MSKVELTILIVSIICMVVLIFLAKCIHTVEKRCDALERTNRNLDRDLNELKDKMMYDALYPEIEEIGGYLKATNFSRDGGCIVYELPDNYKVISLYDINQTLQDYRRICCKKKKSK